MRSWRADLLGTGLVLSLFAGCAREGVERVEWTVMDTIAAVQWRGARDAGLGLRDTTMAAFAQVEGLLNAYASESELSRLAALPDAEILRRCDPIVRPCYAAAFRLRDETGGRFNPRWKGPGTMDLGGIAKGFAVDIAAERAGMAGLIDLGGNLKAVGGEWKVGILGGGDFRLGPGEACATSARYFRGSHIHDGRDGTEIENRIRSVTVVHPHSAMLADGLSTVLFILGRDEGERFLREHHPEARAIWYTTDP